MVDDHADLPAGSPEDAAVPDDRTHALIGEIISSSDQATTLWGFSAGISLTTLVLSIYTHVGFTTVVGALLFVASAWNVDACRKASRQARQWRASYDRS